MSNPDKADALARDVALADKILFGYVLPPLTIPPAILKHLYDFRMRVWPKARLIHKAVLLLITNQLKAEHNWYFSPPCKAMWQALPESVKGSSWPGISSIWKELRVCDASLGHPVIHHATTGYCDLGEGEALIFRPTGVKTAPVEALDRRSQVAIEGSELPPHLLVLCLFPRCFISLPLLGIGNIRDLHEEGAGLIQEAGLLEPASNPVPLALKRRAVRIAEERHPYGAFLGYPVPQGVVERAEQIRAKHQLIP